MTPIKFEGANVLLTRPEDMTDEQCGALPALRDKDEDGLPFLLTAWQPTPEEILAIQAGAPIYLKVCGMGMPPVSLFSTK
jgi:hypothetical protein